MMLKMPVLLTNFILFQIGWFACVLGGANSLPWLGTLIACMIVTYHVYRSNQPDRELLLIVLAIIIGLVWDSLLVWMQLLSYASGMWSENLAPHWIIALWALFATTLNVSLNWLKGRWVIAVISGAIAGPLAYYAGHRLGAVFFSDTSTALLYLGAGWAVFVPVLVWLAQRLDGYDHLPNHQRVGA
jgi:hypothetical protein